MDTNDFQKMFGGLDDTKLAEAEAHLQNERDKRGRQYLDTIKPDMSADERAKVRAEINRVLSGR